MSFDRSIGYKFIINDEFTWTVETQIQKKIQALI